MSKYSKMLTSAVVCLGWLGSASSAEQTKAAASTPDKSNATNVDESSPIYLRHGACSNPFAIDGKKDDSTPTHWNHWSHGNQYSHGSHGSHGSHWNSW